VEALFAAQRSMPAALGPEPVASWVAQMDFACWAASQAERLGSVLIREDASHPAEQDWQAAVSARAVAPERLRLESARLNKQRKLLALYQHQQ